MGIVNAIDVTAEQQEIILRLLELHLPDTKAWVYGSRAKWTSRPQSDLDLVVFATPKQSSRVFDLRDAFEESDLPFNVDLFVWNEIPESFHQQITKDHYVLTEGKKPITHVNATPLVRLCEIADIISRGAIANGRRHGNSALLCDLVDVRSNRFIDSDTRFQKTIATGRDIQRHSPRIGDVLIIIESRNRQDIGKCALVCDDLDNVICDNRIAILRPNSSMVENTYLYYALQAQEVRRQFRALADGVVTLKVRPNDMKNVSIPCPRLTKQKSIAHVLTGLDDKIKLNNQAISTAESLARGLFRSWFVNYDPVRAKSVGLKSYLSDRVLNLFPDQLDGRGRPIGWAQRNLTDIAYTPSRSAGNTDIAGDTPYIGLQQIPRRSIAIPYWESAADRVTGYTSQFKKGETLFGRLMPSSHKVAFAPVDGICTNNIVVVAPSSDKWASFVLHCLSSDEFVNYVHQMSVGSTMARTNWAAMGKYKVHVPPEPVIFEFQDITKPLIERMSEHIHANRRLTRVRDMLIPELISGRINVRSEVETMKYGTQELHGHSV